MHTMLFAIQSPNGPRAHHGSRREERKFSKPWSCFMEEEIRREGIDNWNTFLASKGEATQLVYKKRLLDFQSYCDVENLSQYETSLVQYVKMLHDDRGHAASTIWSNISPLKSFFLMVASIDIEATVPLIGKLLKGWEKRDEVKKSSVFTRLILQLHLSQMLQSLYLHKPLPSLAPIPPML